MISPGSPGPAPTRLTLIEALPDELLEEVAPRLVGRIAGLRPRTEGAELPGEPGVLGRDQPRDVVAESLRERG